MFFKSLFTPSNPPPQTNPDSEDDYFITTYTSVSGMASFISRDNSQEELNDWDRDICPTGDLLNLRDDENENRRNQQNQGLGYRKPTRIFKPRAMEMNDSPETLFLNTYRKTSHSRTQPPKPPPPPIIETTTTRPYLFSLPTSSSIHSDLWSFTSSDTSSFSWYAQDERNHVSSYIARRIVKWSEKGWLKRYFLLVILPVLIVLMWCAVPFPIKFEFEEEAPVVIDGTVPSTSTTSSQPKKSFAFFLLYYYGTFNLVSLLLITKIFQLYSLNWWPSSTKYNPLSFSVFRPYRLNNSISNGVWWIFIAWVASMFLGLIAHRVGLSRYTMTWVTITFLTELVPIIMCFLKVRNGRRNVIVYKNEWSLLEKVFLNASCSTLNESNNTVNDEGSSFVSSNGTHPIDKRDAFGESILGALELDDEYDSPVSPVIVPSSGENVYVPITQQDAADNDDDSDADTLDFDLNAPTTKNNNTSFESSFHNDITGATERLPASYRRFLWFCSILLLSTIGLILSDSLAYLFVSTLPHSTMDGLIYTNSTLLLINGLDALAEYIIYTRIRSWPLQYVFKLYFYMIYFAFYRTLFVRLRSVEQFIIIQFSQAIWVILYYPFLLQPRVYKFLITHCGLNRSYEEYLKNTGRSYFIRNIAESATMLGFLAWLPLLHYGPNAPVYPLFQFKDVVINDAVVNGYTSFELTVTCSIGIFISEIISSYITRRLVKKYFRYSVTREAVLEFLKFPDTVTCMVVVVTQVLMNMLVAIADLKNFV